MKHTSDRRLIERVKSHERTRQLRSNFLPNLSTDNRQSHQHRPDQIDSAARTNLVKDRLPSPRHPSLKSIKMVALTLQLNLQLLAAHVDSPATRSARLLFVSTKRRLAQYFEVIHATAPALLSTFDSSTTAGCNNLQLAHPPPTGRRSPRG